jgi:acyl carrier protein
MNIKEKTKQILNENFEIPMDVLNNESTMLQTMGLDSLDFADMILELERTAGKKVSLNDLRRVKTLGDLYLEIEQTLRAPDQTVTL